MKRQPETIFADEYIQYFTVCLRNMIISLRMGKRTLLLCKINRHLSKPFQISIHAIIMFYPRGKNSGGLCFELLLS